jgi:hypothetical protein
LQAFGVTIDDFETSDSVTARPRDPVDSSSTTSGTFLGGTREMTATFLGGGDATVSGNSGAPPDGRLLFEALPEAQGTLDIIWLDITGADKGPGDDLTAGGTLNAIALEVALNETAVAVSIELTDTAANTGSAAATLAAGPGTSLLLFSDFSGSVDYTDIETIHLQLTTASPHSRLELGDVSSVAVPEPASALLLAAGLAGLCARRRPS